MKKIIITELDQQVNGHVQYISVDEALGNIERYIIEKIDPTFPARKFRNWINSSEEKPFRWNKVRYFWG